jgi:histidinol-phosphate aminotransferase
MIKPREVVGNASAYALTDTARKDKVRLDLNESHWGCSPRVIDALGRIAGGDVSFYPEYDDLSARLASELGVAPERILVTNGSDDAIRCICTAFVEPGSRALIPVPTFSILLLYPRLSEARVVQVPYNEDLSFPVERLLSAVDEATRLIVVVNPNSPTGTSIDKRDFIRILEAAPRAAVILDEAYCTYRGETFVDLVERFANLFVLRTFSKAYGLAGLRIGYVVSDGGNIRELRKVNPPFSVNAMAVAAAMSALDDGEHIRTMLEELALQKQNLCRALRDLGFEVRGTDANFLLVRAGPWAGFVAAALRARKVLVKNLDPYPLLQGWIRVTVGRERENARLLEALPSAMPPEAVLFDMDGVLVDVTSSYRAAIRETVEHFCGRTVEPAEIQALKNAGGYACDWDLTAAAIAARGKCVDREDVIEHFQRLYLGENLDGLIRNESWLADRDTLRRLKGRFKLGIVTGRPLAEADAALARFGVRETFDVVVAMEDVPPGRGKPDPLGLRVAMERLGASHGLYAGDTIDDMKAAAAAGLTAVGVLPPGGGGTERAALEAGGAAWVLDSANDLGRILP